MGWTGIPTKRSIEEISKQEFATYENQIVKNIILDVPKEQWDEFQCEEKEQYIAFRNSNNNIICIVVLWQKMHNEVLYKTMDESSGPYTKTKCPKEIMDVLTPVEKLGGYAGYSKEWRARQ
jgi:predicted transport protein